MNTEPTWRITTIDGADQSWHNAYAALKYAELLQLMGKDVIVYRNGLLTTLNDLMREAAK